MSQLLRITSNDITLEEALEKVKKADGVKLASVIELKEQMVIEVIYGNQPSRNQIKKNIYAALKPHRFQMWRRPEPAKQSTPAHRRS